MKNQLLLALCAILLWSCQPTQKAMVEMNNPIIPGYFADPTIVELDGTYYVYVTADPWGTDFLSCWETTDFKNWKFNKLNWPTAAQCVSELQQGDKVWAPAVIKRDNKYYMYTSVGSEIWVGEADAPLGPWKNMLGDRPLLEGDTTRYCHIIDADIFADEDGKHYLYWGSGFDWINGRCFMAQLNEDMCTFATDPIEVTPANYFEAPFMVKNNGKYYMMYSDGMTIRDTYKVRYAVGDSPFGPFVEAANSPILKTDWELEVIAPGHHCVTNINGENYIFYHKHRLPYVENTAYRQTCVDKMVFTEEGEIAILTPSLHTSLPLAEAKQPQPLAISVTASSAREEYTEAVNVTDSHFGTLWAPAADDATAYLQAVLESEQLVNQLVVLFEYPWQKYTFTVSTSLNGTDWQVVTAKEDFEVGSPTLIEIGQRCKYVKLAFSNSAQVGVWEISLN